MDSTLRDLKASYKKNELLLPMLERHVLKQANADDDERRSDILHPSEMSKGSWCGRHDYYRITKEDLNYAEKKIGFRLANIFDYGHSVHRKYQRWFREMGVLFGRWKCMECEQQWIDISPTMCPNGCKRRVGAEGETPYTTPPRIKYREVPLDYPDLHIAGHADGIVQIYDPVALRTEYVLLEIKTIGLGSLRYEAYHLHTRYIEDELTPEEVWFRISRPFASHLRQAMIYLHLARMLYPQLTLDKIVFIYEFKATQETKEFTVPYNPDLIKDVLEQVDAVADALDDAEPPERPGWAEVDGKVCSDCEYRTTCWGTARPQNTDPAPLRVKRVTSAARRKIIRSGGAGA